MSRTFSVGDPILYFDSEYSGWPGTVLAVKRRVKIRFNHYEGDKIRWVKPEKLDWQLGAEK